MVSKHEFFRPVLVSLCLISLLLCESEALNAQTSTIDFVKGYAPVNGLKMYYEIHGQGKPLLLLHGAFNTIHLAFNELIPGLSKNRQVIAVELQGHGRTADIDRPFSFEAMSDDVAALLKYLKIDSSDILGYSMGGGVAFQLAIRHPELVHKLVIISGAYKSDGWHSETLAIFPNITPQMFEGSPVKKEYDSLAPDPAYWTKFVNKLKILLASKYDWKSEVIASLRAPIFMIIGDADGVRPEHAVEVYHLKGADVMGDLAGLPDSRLAILPGTTHVMAIQRTDWLLSMIPPFLDAPITKRK